LPFKWLPTHLLSHLSLPNSIKIFHSEVIILKWFPQVTLSFGPTSYLTTENSYTHIPVFYRFIFSPSLFRAYLCPVSTQLQCKLSAIKANFLHPEAGFSDTHTHTHKNFQYVWAPENCNNFCVFYFVCGSCPYEIFKCPELRIYAISTLLLFGLPVPEQILYP